MSIARENTVIRLKHETSENYKKEIRFLDQLIKLYEALINRIEKRIKEQKEDKCLWNQELLEDTKQEILLLMEFRENLCVAADIFKKEKTSTDEEVSAFDVKGRS